MAHLITGLDIGSSFIKGVVVTQKSNGTLSLVTAFKHPSAGFRKGVCVDLEDAICVLRDLAVDLQKISRRATHNVYVNVNSEQVKSRASRGIVAVARADQEVQQDDLDRVIQASRAVKLLPNYLVLHNIIREYFVDDVGDIVDPLGMTANRLEVSTFIVESFAPQVNILVKHLERVGFRVSGLIFNPLAAARAVLSKRLRDLGVLLIDFGFGTTSLAVYEEGKIIHTKSIPIGSGYITNDIAIGLKTSIDVAEKLKVEHGCAVAKNINRRDMIRLQDIDETEESEISRRFLSEIIEVRLAEILDLVNNELKVLGRSLQLPAGVIMTGGAAKMPGLEELVRQELRLPVRVGLPHLSSFEITNPAHHDLLNDPECSTAVGLALWGAVEGGTKPTGAAQLIKGFLQNLMP